MLPAFNVLLIWGLIRSIAGTTGPLLRGAGRPALLTRIQTGQLLILAALMYPLIKSFGIVGAAWATVLAAIIPDTIAVALATRVSTAPPRAVIRALALPAITSGVMLTSLLAVERLGLLPSGGWLLIWGPVLGGALYLAATLAARRWAGFLGDGLLPGRG